MKTRLSESALRLRAQMARRALKRTPPLTRPTEAGAMLRANAAHLLARYRATRAASDLEAFVDSAGEGNTFDDDFDIESPAERPSLRPGCARCGERYEPDAFLERRQDAAGGWTTVRRYWCATCRAQYGRLRWQNVLEEDDRRRTRR